MSNTQEEGAAIVGPPPPASGFASVHGIDRAAAPVSRLHKLIYDRRKALAKLETGACPFEVQRPGGAAQNNPIPEKGCQPDVWGLALSGGGIRSATFCFGLLRALAKEKSLLRFDLMSTVSGGAYIGSTIGALFHRASSPQQAVTVQERIGEGNSRGFLWWLRANGRYLIPRGPKDTLFAAALFLRNLAGFHFELGIVCVLLGAVLALFNLLLWSSLDWAAYYRTDFLFDHIRWLPGWLPTVWLIFLPLILLYGLVVSVAFWSLPWARRMGGLKLWARVLAFSLLTTAAWVYLVPERDVGQGTRNFLAVLVPGLGLTWALAIPAAWWAMRDIGDKPLPGDDGQGVLSWLRSSTHPPTRAKRLEDSVDEAMRRAQGRRLVTQWLANAFLALGAFILIGLVDRAAFFMAFEQGRIDLVDMGLLLAVSAGLLRGALPLGARLGPGTKGLGAMLMLGHLLGYALTFAICTWWVSIVYRAALGALFGTLRAGDFVPDFSSTIVVILLIAVPAYTYYKMTGKSLGFLNQSSWHSFYQARLARSYLGAANPNRFSTSPQKSQAVPDKPSMASAPSASADSCAKTAAPVSMAATVDPKASTAGTPAVRSPGASAPISTPPTTPVNPTACNLQGNPALEDVASTMPGRRMSSSSVNDVIEGDDIPLWEYGPHKQGGPVHLLSVCINQTRDPRGKLFNQDRKGLNLTVGPRGWKRESLDPWTKMTPSAGMTLGAWAAISGAAVSPGLGAETRGGLSALAALAGARLGYWWTFEKRVGRPRETVLKEAGFMKLLMLLVRSYKSWGLLNETLGVFEGVDGKDWFLTDGGHFDNTAAYTLLGEQCRVIVLVDASADPDFRFGDLENLVRRARVDLDAEIEFMAPTSAKVAIGQQTPLSEPSIAESTPQIGKSSVQAVESDDQSTDPSAPDISMFGSLNDLASEHSSACIALARVTYQGDDANRGILVYVKPNMSKGLPVDLVNFKGDHPAFPHETTADQFFSEAQWESYFQLGRHLARGIDQTNLAKIAVRLEEFFELDRDETLSGHAKKLASSKKTADAEAASDERDADNNGRLPSRIAAAAVGTTIGIGAFATVAVSAYQAFDGYRTGEQKRVQAERDAFKALTDLWGASPPFMRDRGAGSQKMAADLAGALLRTADTLCPTKEAGWFHESPLARKILNDSLKLCSDFRAPERPYSCTVLLESQNKRLRTQLSYCLADFESARTAVPKKYWLYNFKRTAATNNMHPCDPLRDDVLRAEQDFVREVGDLTYRAEKWRGGCHARLLLPEALDGEGRKGDEKNGGNGVASEESGGAFAAESPVSRSTATAVWAPGGDPRSREKWPLSPGGVVAALAASANSITTTLAKQSAQGVHTEQVKAVEVLPQRYTIASAEVAVKATEGLIPYLGNYAPSSREIEPLPSRTYRSDIGQKRALEDQRAERSKNPNRPSAATSALDQGSANCVAASGSSSACGPMPTKQASVAPGKAQEPQHVAPPSRSWGCSDIRVFIQVYNPEDFQRASVYKTRLLVAGARVPPIENVNETAQRAGRPFKMPVSRTRLRYHDNDARLCAESLRQYLPDKEKDNPGTWVVEPLSSTLRPSPKTLELWLRPE